MRSFLLSRGFILPLVVVGVIPISLALVTRAWDRLSPAFVIPGSACFCVGLELLLRTTSLFHYATWSAWLKVWISTKLFGDIWLLRSILKYLASGDRRILETLDDVPTPPFDRVMRANVNFADAEIQAAHQGRISHDEAANRIFARLRDSDWLPHHTYKWGVPAVRHNDFSRPDKLPLAVMWGKTLAPTWVRRDLFDFPVGPLLKAKALEALSRVN